MNKYNFDLDMKSDNSNSVILKNIKQNSNILEFGCAYGRMTKFLKENLNCNISICEIDHDAGLIASKWANQFFIGENGDIERNDFFDNIKRSGISNLDYIIFADVLEHLKNPELILNNSKELLSKNGSIWISIPNVAHNSVLIDLCNNKFTYRDVGLLDNTHIKFFTYYSLKNMIEKCSLKIVNEFNLINPVKNTEFKNDYSDVPYFVQKYLKSREFSEVYQFVWELSL